MRILFLSSWFPYPPVNGAKIRIFSLIRQLSKRHELTLVSFADGMSVGEAREHYPELEKYCRKVTTVPARVFRPRSAKALVGLLSARPRSVVATFDPAIQRLVERELSGDRYDVLVASDVGPGVGVAPYAARVKIVPSVLDALEVATLKESHRHQRGFISTLRHKLMWQKHRRYLSQIVPRFAACTVPSIQERNHVLEICPSYERARVVAHGLDLTRYKGCFGKPQPRTLIFTGSLIYPVNLDAIGFFLEQVYPIVRARVPDVKLRVTGSIEGVSLDQLAVDGGVTFTGLLDDVRPYVAQSWVSVAPIRIGAGTRLKIIEAMALGTPVVATSKGAEGLDVTHGEDILIGDDPIGFANYVIELMGSPDLRARLAHGGRRLVEEKYNAVAMGNRMETVLQEVCTLWTPVRS